MKSFIVERVDDVMHVFLRIEVDDSDYFHVSHYPHVTRQWYEKDRLYIASLSSPEATREGLSTEGFGRSQCPRRRDSAETSPERFGYLTQISGRSCTMPI
jgi:hypothetical protein